MDGTGIPIELAAQLAGLPEAEVRRLVRVGRIFAMDGAVSEAALPALRARAAARRRARLARDLAEMGIIIRADSWRP